VLQAKVIEKNLKRILCSSNFCFRKSCRLRDVEKYGRAGQAKDDIIIRRRKDAIFMPGN
jgi:hypothetical protein